VNIQDYLSYAETLPWKWGGGITGWEGHDCTLFCGGWPVFRGQPDPGEGIRGTYSTEREALMIVRRAGGMEAFIGERLSRIGWKRVEEPQDGDIGVVHALTFDGPAWLPAIRAGGLWVGRNPWGQSAADYPCRAIFRG